MHQGEYEKQAERRRERCHTVNHNAHITTVLGSEFFSSTAMKEIAGHLGSLSSFNHLEIRIVRMELSALRDSGSGRHPVLHFGNGGLRQALLPANLDEILLQGHHGRILAPKKAFQPSKAEALKKISDTVRMY